MTTTPEEDLEVEAYFRNRRWPCGKYLDKSSNQFHSMLHVENPDKILEKADISPDDWKMIARSKTVYALNLHKAKVDDDDLKNAASIPRLEIIVVGGDDITNAGLKALAACKSLQVVNLVNCKNVNDDGVRELAALPNLHILTFANFKIDGSAFEAFAGSKSLHSIVFDYAGGLSDSGARHLAKLPNLNELVIRGRNKLTTAGIKDMIDVRLPAHFVFDSSLIDDALLESLVNKGWLYGPSPPPATQLEGLTFGEFHEKKPATAEEVKYIYLAGSKVTDKGMTCLFNCLNFTSISLQETGITDETLKNLSRFKQLHDLDVGKTKVTGATLEALVGLPLRQLHMEECDLCENAFQSMAKMVSLEDLWLFNAKTKGDWLKHISALPNLKKLNLQKADLDDGAVKYLTSMPKLEDLGLNYTKLGDAGFQEIVKMPNLKSLVIDGTKVSKEAISKAKKDYPKLNLY